MGLGLSALCQKARATASRWRPDGLCIPDREYCSYPRAPRGPSESPDECCKYAEDIDDSERYMAQLALENCRILSACGTYCKRKPVDRATVTQKRERSSSK
jgi:hypothetical protein